MITVLVWAVITKCHRLGHLNKQKCISHNSGVWEVQDEDAGSFGFWSKSSPWLVRQVPSPCILTWWRETLVPLPFLIRTLIPSEGLHSHDLI